jgi:hypothetical protein
MILSLPFHRADTGEHRKQNKKDKQDDTHEDERHGGIGIETLPKPEKREEKAERHAHKERTGGDSATDSHGRSEGSPGARESLLDGFVSFVLLGARFFWIVGFVKVTGDNVFSCVARRWVNIRADVANVVRTPRMERTS